MQHNIQELQAQLTKGQLGMAGPQSLMFLPFLEQLRGLPIPTPMPPPTSTTTTGSKHINSIANVCIKFSKLVAFHLIIVIIITVIVVSIIIIGYWHLIGVIAS
jgi:hypothetical protein